jgi:membrane-bound toxin of toxin-antitoxin system
LLSENHNSFLLEPATSRFFAVIIIVVHGLAIIASIVNVLPFTLKLTLNIAVCFNLIFMLQQYYFTAKNFSLRYSAGQGWQFATGKDFYPIEILPTTVITRFVTILHFKGQDGEKWAILIFSDAVTAENYRKLKVQLKITEHS